MKPVKTSKKTVFIIYLAFMFWIIVLRGQFSIKPITLVPKATIIPFFYKDLLPDEVPVMDSIVRILFYFPLGYIIQWMNLNIVKRGEILLILLISVIFNLLQFLLRTGRFDLTDIIICTIGGTIGLYAYSHLIQNSSPASDQQNKAT